MVLSQQNEQKKDLNRAVGDALHITLCREPVKHGNE
jgi:hypothetical protein